MSRLRGNGSGSITSYKTAKGKRKYRIRVTVDTYFDEETGKFKTISKSLGAYDTKAEAEAVLAEYNNSPYDLTTKIITVGDLYKVWSESYFKKISPSAKRTVEAAWAYCDDIAKLPLKKLGSKHIEDVMYNGTREVIRGSSKEVRKASINTQMRIKSIFNLMLDYAVGYKLLQSNVARTFDINDMRKEAEYQKKIKEPFTQEELNLFWENVEEFPFIDMLLVGCYMGYRPSELCELKVINVSLDENYIIGGNKTLAGKDRKVPINPLIKPFVEKRYKQAIKLGSIWLFNDRFSQTGYHVTYDKYRHRFEDIMKYLGIPDKTGHCQRVTFITKCYQAGIPEYMIKRLVGHSLKGNVTDGVYNRVSLEDLYEAVCKIEK